MVPGQVVDFIGDLRSLMAKKSSESGLLADAKPLLLRLAQSHSWRSPALYKCDPEQGFGVTVLHEEPGYGLWLVAVAWLPRRGAPPHNHGTWAVVAGVDGSEKNILWRRRGALLERQGEEVLGPGQVAAFTPNAIHSVLNESERTTLSLHVYGRNLNFAERSQFDAETGAEKPFKLQLRPVPAESISGDS